jgi:site-specific DNA recombinase
MENINEELSKCKQSIPNPDEAIKNALILSSKLTVVWHSNEIGKKEKLQKLVFPDGIIYDHKNVAF